MRYAGTTLVFLAVVAWMIDRFSQVISSTLGKVICGDRYLQPVRGVSGDGSCGFNADMYLFVLLAVVLVTGIVLIIR